MCQELSAAVINIFFLQRDVDDGLDGSDFITPDDFLLELLVAIVVLNRLAESQESFPLLVQEGSFIAASGGDGMVLHVIGGDTFQST